MARATVASSRLSMQSMSWRAIEGSLLARAERPPETVGLATYLRGQLRSEP